jgi:hypothetical protein
VPTAGKATAMLTAATSSTAVATTMPIVKGQHQQNVNFVTDRKVDRNTNSRDNNSNAKSYETYNGNSTQQ